MDLILFALLAVAMVFIVYKNLSMLKRVKHNNSYIDCYKAMLNENEGAYELINKTIENEPSEEFKHKTRLFKLYCELDNKDSMNTCIDEIDLREIFYKKGQLDKQMTTLNSDSFLWIMMVMVKARNASRFDVIDELVKRTVAMEELSNRLEYQMIINLSKSLKEEDDLGLVFFKDLLEGNTYKYAHDKQLIGLYKRIAACMLEVNSELFDDYYKEDLSRFADTLIGKAYMKHIGNYDKYHVEVAEETSEEVKEELKEENKEEE